MTTSAVLLLVALAAQAPGVPTPAVVAPMTPAERSGEVYFLFLQARTQEDRGATAEAEATYRRAIALAPSVADLHADLAALLARAGRIEDSVAEARAALRLDDGNREAHRILGLVQATLLDQRSAPADALTLAEAVDHLERTLSDGTRDPGAQATLGSLYVRGGQHGKAIKILNAFLIDQPGHPQGVMLLAEAYRLNGQPAEAAAVLREAMAPAGAAFDLQAELRRAEQAEVADRWEEAAAIWNGIVTSGPAGATYRQAYAIALVNSGDLEASRRVLRDLTRDEPTEAGSWFLLAEVETRAGNADAVEDAGRRLVALKSDDPRGPIALAQARSLRGDARGVIAVLDGPVTAARQADRSSGAYARMAVLLGRAYAQSQDVGRARVVLERAASTVPESSAVQSSLADLHFDAKRYKEAAQAWDRALAGDQQGIDVADITRKRDRARALSGSSGVR